jgi:cytochrome c556
MLMPTRRIVAWSLVLFFASVAAFLMFELSRWNIEGAEGIVALRQGEMEIMYAKRAALVNWTRGRSSASKADVVKLAEDIAVLGRKIETNFRDPEGSAHSRALPEIWRNHELFDSLAVGMVSEAERTREALLRDSDVDVQVERLHKSCMNCHHAFRLRKPILVWIHERTWKYLRDEAERPSGSG